jgi:biotin carboxyl carrier protein
MFTITVNNNKTFEYKEENGQKKLDNQEEELDIREVEAGFYHVLYKGKSYRASLLEVSAGYKRLRILLNGHAVEVEVREPLAQWQEKSGRTKAGQEAGTLELKAPMPGLIVGVQVVEGQTVRKGEPLLILEAMKMENVLKAPSDGLVRQISVQKGDIVEKNQLLIKF